MLRLGILGSSPGNGHPYSWAAIFNGYDPVAMAACPYPTIPDYLGRQVFPRDAISDAQVSHVWTQDRELSQHIAAASRIPHVVDRPEAMLGAVDAILLARDDAESHLTLAAPFLRAGLPIYIDKPLALSVAEAESIYALERCPGQIFTGSALAFAAEFRLAEADRQALGRLRHFDAQTPKAWETYAMHVIDPLVDLAAREGPVVSIEAHPGLPRHVDVRWRSGATARITALGEAPGALSIVIDAEHGRREMVFSDTFGAFRAALQSFVDIIRRLRPPQDRSRALAAIRLLEAGCVGGAEADDGAARPSVSGRSRST